MVPNVIDRLIIWSVLLAGLCAYAVVASAQPGQLTCIQMPALTGDITTLINSCATTVHTAPTLAIGGATLGSNALAVTGTSQFNGAVTADGVVISGGSSGATIGTNAGNLTLAPVATRVAIATPTYPTLQFNSTSNGTDLKNWDVLAVPTAFGIQATNDALSIATTAYQILRGTTYNVTAHDWYTSTVAGSSNLGMSLTNSMLTVTPGGAADGVVISGGSSGAFVQSSGGFLQLNSPSGGTFLTVGSNNALAATAGGADYVTVQGGSSGATIGTSAGTLTLSSGGGASTTLTDSGITMSNAAYYSCPALTTNSTGLIGCTVSDKRLKIDGGVVSDQAALSDILAMPDLHSYQFKDGYGPGGNFVGYFAQDIKAAHPGWVHKGAATALTPDGTLGYDQNYPVSRLSGAVKALQHEIDAVSHGLPASSADPIAALNARLDWQQYEIDGLLGGYGLLALGLLAVWRRK